MDNQQPSLKRCRICELEKPSSDFRVFSCKGRKPRITDICTVCHKRRTHEWYLERKKIPISPEERKLINERSKKWRDDHPEKRKAISLRNHHKRRNRDRQLVYAYYGGQCECCGEKEPRFLTVDHINDDGCIERKKGVYTNGSQFYRYIVQCNFPDYYRLLCFNCNLGRAKNGGICPHKEGSTTISQESRTKRSEAPTTLRGNDIV